MAFPYIPKDWVGTADPLTGEPGATPITEDALNHLETQYDSAVDYTDDALQGHANSASPHPAYDDMASFTLIFENGLV